MHVLSDLDVALVEKLLPTFLDDVTTNRATNRPFSAGRDGTHDPATVPRGGALRLRIRVRQSDACAVVCPDGGWFRR